MCVLVPTIFHICQIYQVHKAKESDRAMRIVKLCGGDGVYEVCRLRAGHMIGGCALQGRGGGVNHVTEGIWMC